MFKLVLSLALLAACSANLYNNKEADYHVNVGHDHIIVTNNYGYQVNFIIERHSGTGEQIYVQVTGQGQVVESEQIVNQPVTLTGNYEADILYQVFDNFNGILDEPTYQKLIYIVAQHVQDGHVHPIVLYVLQLLANQQQSVQLLDPSHQQYYNTVQGLFSQIGYNQTPYYGHGYGYSGLGGYGSWSGIGKYGYSGLGGYGSWYGIGKPSYGYGSWYGIGKPAYSGVGGYGSWYGVGKPSYSGLGGYGSWSGIGKYGHSGLSGYGSWYGIGKPSYGYGSWYGIGKPAYSGVGGYGSWYGMSTPAYGSWSGYGKQGYSGLGAYGSWYGLSKQSYNYPGVYSPSWTQSYNGPYSSGAWSYPSQVYGHSGYGYASQVPYGGYWSQWQGAYPYQSQLLVN